MALTLLVLAAGLYSLALLRKLLSGVYRFRTLWLSPMSVFQSQPLQYRNKMIVRIKH